MEELLETWKPIEGYEERYEVSSKGNVRSLGHNVCFLDYGKCVDFYRDGKLLKPTVNKYGYFVVSLYDTSKKKQKQYKIHRLVAETFIPNVENKPMIDHINAIKTDNRVENLRWCTHKENMNNPHCSQKRSDYMKRNNPMKDPLVAKKNGAKRMGTISPARKPVKAKKDGITLIFPSITTAGQELGLNISLISAVLHNKQHHTGGYSFEYLQ